MAPTSDVPSSDAGQTRDSLPDDAPLAQRAAFLLRDGPRPTLEIASDVLRLSGNPGAARAAVEALLGTDPRFEALAGGAWGLRPGADPAAGPLDRLRYAVVDVETTGSLRWRGHGIVEIAILEVRDGQLADLYHTLLDPGRPIAPFVTGLTGITPRMVVGAPRFEDVADQVAARLEDRIFVAHNVGFDWWFVRDHLRRSGYDMAPGPRLCTVHLARRLLPRVRRRNLDALAEHFRIDVPDRHRAFGDALATGRILLRLLDEARAQGLRDMDSLLAFIGRGA